VTVLQRGDCGKCCVGRGVAGIAAIAFSSLYIGFT
jgi:hypothetical protein